MAEPPAPRLTAINRAGGASATKPRPPATLRCVKAVRRASRSLRIQHRVDTMAERMKFIRWFSDLGVGDVALVGGKNASLGEM